MLIYTCLCNTNVSCLSLLSVAVYCPRSKSNYYNPKNFKYFNLNIIFILFYFYWRNPFLPDVVKYNKSDFLPSDSNFFFNFSYNQLQPLILQLYIHIHIYYIYYLYGKWHRKLGSLWISDKLHLCLFAEMVI